MLAGASRPLLELFTIYRVLLPRVVLNHKTLAELRQVSSLEIEVCSPNDPFAIVGCHPVDNLWRIRAQVSRIILIEGLAILPGENPNISELPVPNELEVSLESGAGHGRCRRLRGGGISRCAVRAALTASK